MRRTLLPDVTTGAKRTPALRRDINAIFDYEYPRSTRFDPIRIPDGLAATNGTRRR
jgi:hypothetical protein